ncbi:MAG: hypothetical protein IAC13_01935 [Firmicutes bacterium]|uniref:Uncharacterized protein n=1 Tax=Candidatus Scybalomonas excrementavium TaxID=2840943 RepID=A0A9D9I020_9FIRM|nr:hypothetical protein [Candidatus Scybalomonas excrementavium]
MRASKETYEKVAKKCTSYDKKDQGVTNSACDSSCPSCLNCTHFTSDEYCVLDLYDPIAKNL